MKVYHGTSFENLRNMFEGKESPKNWRVSNNDVIYVYANGKRDMERAFDSAVMCAAIQKSNYVVVVVLEFDVDEDKLSIDKSDGMDCIDKTRWCISQEDFKDLFPNVNIHYFEYNPELRWMYLYNLYHSCCCLDWDLAKYQVVDYREIVDKCDEWYNENHEYEWHFIDQLPPECKEVFINTVLGFPKVLEKKKMSDKVLVKGLNTIIYHHSSRENINQFLFSLKFKSGIFDNLSVMKFDDIEINYNNMSKIAVESFNNDKITIMLMEVNDIARVNNRIFIPRLKNATENYGLVEASHVVLIHNPEKDKFDVVKHRESPNVLHKEVDYNDLI